MTDCTRWQQQIDELTQLTATQVAALNQHLSGCADCTQYRRERDRVVQALHGLKDTLPLGTAPEFAIATMQARLARSRRQSRIAWFGSLIAVSAVVWFAAQQQLNLVGGIVLLGVAVLCGLIGWWFGRLQRLAAAGVGASGGPFLKAWSQSIGRQLWITRIIGGIAVFDGGALLTAAIRAPGELILLGAIGTPLLLAGLYTLFGEVPALKRELQMARGVR